MTDSLKIALGQIIADAAEYDCRIQVARDGDVTIIGVSDCDGGWSRYEIHPGADVDCEDAGHYSGPGASFSHPAHTEVHGEHTLLVQHGGLDV